MTKDEVVKLAIKSALIKRHDCEEWLCNTGNIETFAKLIEQHERKACEALHDHEDVQAPIGNSAWGEAYQEGWGQGTAAYRDAIRETLNTEETV